MLSQRPFSIDRHMTNEEIVSNIRHTRPSASVRWDNQTCDLLRMVSLPSILSLPHFLFRFQSSLSPPSLPSFLHFPPFPFSLSLLFPYFTISGSGNILPLKTNLKGVHFPLPTHRVTAACIKISHCAKCPTALLYCITVQTVVVCMRNLVHTANGFV